MEQARAYAAIVIAGDLLDISSPVPLQAQIAVVREYLGRIAEGTQLAVCSGNHDLDHRRSDGEKATRWLTDARTDGIHTDGESFRLGPHLVSVLPWWEGPITRAPVEQQLREDQRQPRDLWIWVYHSPPTGLLSWTGSRHFGDDAVETWVDTHRPDVVLCGHIHQSPFSREGSWFERRGSTILFNPGREPGDRPAHVVVDLEAGEAHWRSWHDQQSTGLSAARPASP